MIWFKFYSAWSDGLQELSDAEAGRFIKALCACAESAEIPSLSGAEKVLYAIAAKQLKQDTERNAKISSARAEAGRIGGLSSKQTEANISNCLENKQMQAKQANASNCSIKNKELRIKNKEINIAETSVSAQGKSQLSPDDSGYWQAFRENAELAETFYKVSGISPAGDFGRWQKELKQFSEACITPEILKAAILQMRQSGLTIYSPGSVYKVARSLQAKPRVSYTTGDRWDRAAEKIESELASDSLFSLMQPKEVRQ